MSFWYKITVYSLAILLITAATPASAEERKHRFNEIDFTQDLRATVLEKDRRERFMNDSGRVIGNVKDYAVRKFENNTSGNFIGPKNSTTKGASNKRSNYDLKNMLSTSDKRSAQRQVRSEKIRKQRAKKKRINHRQTVPVQVIH